MIPSSPFCVLNKAKNKDERRRKSGFLYLSWAREILVKRLAGNIISQESKSNVRYKEKDWFDLLVLLLLLAAAFIPFESHPKNTAFGKRGRRTERTMELLFLFYGRRNERHLEYSIEVASLKRSVSWSQKLQQTKTVSDIFWKSQQFQDKRSEKADLMSLAKRKRYPAEMEEGHENRNSQKFSNQSSGLPVWVEKTKTAFVPSITSSQEQQ